MADFLFHNTYSPVGAIAKLISLTCATALKPNAIAKKLVKIFLFIK